VNTLANYNNCGENRQNEAGQARSARPPAPWLRRARRGRRSADLNGGQVLKVCGFWPETSTAVRQLTDCATRRGRAARRGHLVATPLPRGFGPGIADDRFGAGMPPKGRGCAPTNGRISHAARRGCFPRSARSALTGAKRGNRGRGLAAGRNCRGSGNGILAASPNA
jgi:hypothetical protein